MFAKERKDEILKMLQENGKVRTLELSETFNVSEPTIRRDIADLNQSGLLIRTHGGALAIQEIKGEPSFSEKIDAYSSEKREIGKAAATLITKGKTVVLDGGTTTLEIMKNITAEDVTVITNSLDIAELSEHKDNITLILLGGVMRWNTRALVGPITEKALRTFSADIAFIGANGVSLNAGITTQNMIEASTKEVMVDIAERSFLVADHTKFGKQHLCVIATLSKISGIITDSKTESSVIAAYESENVEIIK